MTHPLGMELLAPAEAPRSPWADGVRAARRALQTETEPEPLRRALRDHVAALPGVGACAFAVADGAGTPADGGAEPVLPIHDGQEPPQALVLRLEDPSAWTPERAAAVETLVALYEARVTVGAAMTKAARQPLHDDLLRRLARFGTWSWDLTLDRVQWSDEVLTMFGFERANFDGEFESIRARVHPGDLAAWEEDVQRCIEDGHVHDLEFRVVWPDGTERVIAALGDCERDPAGRPTHMIGVVLDVTDRARADHALRISAERFRSLMQQTSEGFYLFEFSEPVPIDLPAEAQVDRFYRDGALVECNDAFARMYGVERAEQIVGRGLTELHGGSDNPDNRAFLRSCVENDYRVQGVLSEEVDDQGETLWVSNDIMGIVEGGRLIRVWGTQTDVTQIRRAEAEREQLQQQLAQAQRLDSLGRLAGGVAHDLNNLLTPIIGYGDLLRSEIPPELGLTDMIEELVQASFRAKELVQRLLAFGRRQPIEARTIDLGETLAGLETLLRRTIPADVTFRVDVGPVPPIRGDSGQIERVVMNLVSNAVAAMPEGGALTVEVTGQVVDAEASERFAEVPPGRYAVLSVTDTGIGMDAETKARIFEPFFSTKGELGLGLGLATVYGIVRQHEGFVWLDTEPGQGTTFRVHLPAVDAPAASRPPRGRTQDLAGRERVLLVEDDQAVRHMTVAVLHRLGYEARPAASGREALARLDEGFEPDVLLTDVILPGMNGRQIHEAVARRVPAVKTLFMSGYTDAVIETRGVQQDGVHFIHKPFTLRNLGSKLREILDAAD